MDVYGVREQGGGLPRVHAGGDAVDGFVSAGADDGGAEDALRFFFNQNFDKAEGLAFLDGA